MSISGDVGQIDATKIASLTVGSIGLFTNVQGVNSSNESTIAGPIGILKITGSVSGSTLSAASIGTLTVGGLVKSSTFDVAGNLGTATFGNAIEDSALLAFNATKLTIKGGLLGAAGSVVGATGSRLEIANNLISATILGTVAAAKISATMIGKLLIKGDILGGLADDSGSINVGIGGIAKLTIQGSILGDFGAGTGNITTTGRIGAATITGSIVGGLASDTGVIRAGAGGIGKLTISGSLAMADRIDGYTVSNSGLIHSEGDIDVLKIGGDVRGAYLQESADSTIVNNGAAIRAEGSIGSLAVSGSLIGARIGFGPTNYSRLGEITVGGTIGNLTVGGSIVGDNAVRPWEIFAVGPDAPTNGRFDAFGKIIVGGSVINATIGAGFDRVDAMNGDDNINAGFGSVLIKGDYVSSNVGAGTSGGLNLFPAVASRIGSIVVGGAVSGGGGFAAKHIVSFKLGASKLAVTPGPNNDELFPFANSTARIDEIF